MKFQHLFFAALTASVVSFSLPAQEPETPETKMNRVISSFQKLQKEKKQSEAETLLRQALEDPSYQDSQLRRLINLLAGQYLWGPKYEEGLALLNQAQNLKTNVQNDYFATYNLMGNIYLSRKKQPEAAIEVMQNVIKVKEMHPANLSTAHVLTASAYEMMNNKGKALEHYKLALEAANRVTYPFDKTQITKGLERNAK